MPKWEFPAWNDKQPNRIPVLKMLDKAIKLAKEKNFNYGHNKKRN